MDEKPIVTGGVRNVYKNDRLPTREEYTRIWIDLINRLERMKAAPCASSPEEKV